MLREVELEAEVRRLKEANKRLISEIDHRDCVIDSLTNQVNSTSLILIKLQQERDRFFLMGKEKKRLERAHEVQQKISLRKDQAITTLIESNKMFKHKVAPLLEHNKELAGHNAELMQNILDLRRDVEEKERLLEERHDYFNMLVEKTKYDAESKIKAILENDMKTIIDLKRELERKNI